MADEWRDLNVRDTYIPCTCFQCKKVFIPPVKTLWAYKRGNKSNRRQNGQYLVYFCSWNCMRAYDKTYIPPKGNRGKKKKEVTA